MSSRLSPFALICSVRDKPPSKGKGTEVGWLTDAKLVSERVKLASKLRGPAAFEMVSSPPSLPLIKLSAPANSSEPIFNTILSSFNKRPRAMLFASCIPMRAVSADSLRSMVAPDWLVLSKSSKRLFPSSPPIPISPRGNWSKASVPDNPIAPSTMEIFKRPSALPSPRRTAIGLKSKVSAVKVPSPKMRNCSAGKASAPLMPNHSTSLAADGISASKVPSPCSFSFHTTSPLKRATTEAESIVSAAFVVPPAIITPGSASFAENSASSPRQIIVPLIEKSSLRGGPTMVALIPVKVSGFAIASSLMVSVLSEKTIERKRVGKRSAGALLGPCQSLINKRAVDQLDLPSSLRTSDIFARSNSIKRKDGSPSQREVTDKRPFARSISMSGARPSSAAAMANGPKLTER